MMDYPTEELDIMNMDQLEPWKQELVYYLHRPDGKVELKLKQKALKYVMIGMSCIERASMEFC